MAEKWATLDDIAGQKKLTPMMRQFMEAKAECGASLLFFRMGDFYELFLDDAVVAAEILGLTLTSRDKVGSGKRVPMAGMPYRAVDQYIARLIRAGKTVTLCDQVEDPKDAKGIVKREIIRTVTPGTVMAPELLEETANNYLAAVHVNGAAAGIAFLDMTTGDFLAAELAGDLRQGLADELNRMGPAEVLVAESLPLEWLERLKLQFDAATFTTRDDYAFDAGAGREALLETFELGTLKGVGLEDVPQAVACAGALLGYVQQTQRGSVPHVRTPRRYNPSGYVVLDANTQRNLELVESTFDKRRRGSLLGVLDKTATSMGGRKIRQWILHPLLSAEAIRERLGAVEELHNDGVFRAGLTEAYQGIADIERLLGRITARTGNARDLKALGHSLARVSEIVGALQPATSPCLSRLRDELDPLEDVVGWIEKAVVEEPPLAITDGDILNDGYDEELDRLRVLVRGGREWIATLQREESARTGIPNLKVGYNKVFGYYIEITRSHAGKVPEDYERKQTLVNAERYITPGLKSREEEIVTAQERMQKMEYDLFCALRERVSAEARRIQETADVVAVIDVLQTFAAVAVAKHYAKPSIDDSRMIEIRDGRHPVVEDLMARGEFVPNDSVIDGQTTALQIITGPNMAGKSTYLRQVALITLMAQIGSFVPAASARIGVVDRIFTRVGASDNLVRGESTFMVEMIETAGILSCATDRSLLVLDEIGRGTSTFDGISIAWSVAEHIHNHIGAKTLFATHYHELTELANTLERAKNLNVAVREWGGKVVFLYRIVDGGADHSYGIQVAKLAGLPPEVIERSREILASLESGNTAALGLPEQMYLFSAAPPKAEPSAVERELKLIEPDELSPKDAHDLVRHLKGLLGEDQ